MANFGSQRSDGHAGVALLECGPREFELLDGAPYAKGDEGQEDAEEEQDERYASDTEGLVGGRRRRRRRRTRHHGDDLR